MKATLLEKYTIWAYVLLKLRNFTEKEIFDSGFFHIPAYKELHGLIRKVGAELKSIIDGVSQLRKEPNESKVEFLDAFIKYIGALRESTLLLENIVGKLESKSDGGQYPWNEYDKDVKEYERAVAQYMKLGEGLTELGMIYNRFPKTFLNFLEETVDILTKDLRKKLFIEVIDQFKNSIFSES